MRDDIVLVDDDTMVAELVQRMLRSQTLQLRAFHDPLEALSYLQEHTARLLIVDTRMPRMDGPELLVRLDELGRLDDSRVLLCSAGRLLDTEWSLRLPPTVESISKDELLDRRTLAERFAAIDRGSPPTGSVAA